MSDFDFIDGGGQPTYNPQLPNTGPETRGTQDGINVSLGYGTAPAILKASEQASGSFFCVHVVNEAILDAITILNSTGSANLVGIQIPAGFPIYGGTITNVAVNTGVVICYK